MWKSFDTFSEWKRCFQISPVVWTRSEWGRRVTCFIIFFVVSLSTSVSSSLLNDNSSIKNNSRLLSCVHELQPVTCLPRHPPQDRFNHSHKCPSLNPSSHSNNSSHRHPNSGGILNRPRHRSLNRESQVTCHRPPVLRNKVRKFFELAAENAVKSVSNWFPRTRLKVDLRAVGICSWHPPRALKILKSCQLGGKKGLRRSSFFPPLNRSSFGFHSCTRVSVGKECDYPQFSLTEMFANCDIVLKKYGKSYEYRQTANRRTYGSKLSRTDQWLLTTSCRFYSQ